MDERNNDFDFDFMPIGQAIKKAREARGMTREQLSGIIGYAPRHIQSIENEGKYPSIELFIQLITMFDVSVDEYRHILSFFSKNNARFVKSERYDCHICLDLDTECGVKRNNLFVILKTKVLCRELNRIGGLVGFHIDL